MIQVLPKYWGYFDLEQVRGVRDFKDLSQVALRVLRRMAEDGPVVQVCGPITNGGLGCRQLNVDRFRTAIEILGADGYNVFDQMPFQPAMIKLLQSGFRVSSLLEDFYGAIFRSGLVRLLFFLPLWETSSGAIWERRQILLHRLPFTDFPEDLLVLTEDAKALFPTT